MTTPNDRYEASVRGGVATFAAGALLGGAVVTLLATLMRPTSRGILAPAAFLARLRQPVAAGLERLIVAAEEQVAARILGVKKIDHARTTAPARSAR